MRKRKLWVSVCFCSLFLVMAMTYVTSAEAAYPEKPIRMIVSYPPGGNTDIVARAIQNKMSDAIGKQIVIENKGGAGGTLGTDIAAKSPADGYTVLMVSAAHVINPSMVKHLPYDTVRDFHGVCLVADVPSVLVAHPSVPFRNVKSLVAYAKANPGKINCASSGYGTMPHLSLELLKWKANIDVVHVPYKGNSPAMIDLLGGHVQMLFSSMPAAIGHIRSGKLVPIAMSGKTRSQAAPDIPTLAEGGLAGCEVSTGFSLFAPTGTPNEYIKKLNASVIKALEDPGVKAALQNLGAEPVGSTPEELDDFVRSEIVKWQGVVKAAGIKAQ